MISESEREEVVRLGDKNVYKELRKRTGLSQSKFSKLLGIPLGTIQGWELGRRTPPEYLADLIERVLRAEGHFKDEKKK